MVKNPRASAGDVRNMGSNLGSILLLGKLHGQRSLAGCSPRGLKELDTPAHAHMLTLYKPGDSQGKMINP